MLILEEPRIPVRHLGDDDEDNQLLNSNEKEDQLYKEARWKQKRGEIKCRTIRTSLVKCHSDEDFLAKLHCLRLAFQHLLQDNDNYEWLVQAGKKILGDLLVYANKDPKGFESSYDDMMKYLQDPSSTQEMEGELKGRGVKALTFYDVMLDFILMDAFGDLDKPPAPVKVALQNKWLSNSFKETALNTVIRTFLKTKRKTLKVSSGFMSRFYTISEHITPLLAWGCLGSDEILQETCNVFKMHVLEFLADIFNSEKCNFNSLNDLSNDVLSHLKLRVDAIWECLKPPTNTQSLM